MAGNRNYYIQCKKADFAEISAKFNISPILARIIRNRDIVTCEDIDMYLNRDVSYLYDPFLLKDMDRAVEIIAGAIQDKVKIRVVGDYDTDGICAAYILKKILKAAGANADIRIPDRVSEGYGLNSDIVREAKADRIGLIITCDNGISAHGAVEEAKKNGMQVIVSDHHEVSYPLVGADAVIDAKQDDCSYPFREICGAAVAYKIADALCRKLVKAQEGLLKELLVFAGLATIADVVPLKDENRIFAKECIKNISNIDNAGLKSLLEVKKIDRDKLSAFHIGFIIAPCLNSAGRLKDADAALRLLESKDKKEAERLAKELSELNETRKTMTNSGVIRAEKLADSILEKDDDTRIIAVYLKDTHESIAGIIAGRLKDEYSRPVLVITDSEKGLKGSGRSVDAYNMIEALREHGELFDKLGGHAKAAGFSLAEGISAGDVSAALNASCALSVSELAPKHWIDMVLPFKYISCELIKELELLEPAGLGNPRAVFAGQKLKISDLVILGMNKNVLKMSLTDPEGIKLEALMFGNELDIAERYGEVAQTEKEGKEVSIVYQPQLNEFRGNTRIQLKLLDII